MWAWIALLIPWVVFGAAVAGGLPWPWALALTAVVYTPVFLYGVHREG